jgi:dinuclear metal center YbgI/SA1388 family protein
MRTIGDLYAALDAIAPFQWAFTGDKVGLNVGDFGMPVERVLVCLDATIRCLHEAIVQDCQAVVSHHPIIWDPLKSVSPLSPPGFALRNGLSVIGFHTNWDLAPDGINDTLSAKLGLADVVPIGGFQPLERRKLVVTAPPSAADALIDAATGAGAGAVGLYSRVACVSEATGTWLAGEGANPYVGELGQVTWQPEVRIEMELPASSEEAVREALLAAHPYEEPVIDFYALAGRRTIGISRLGRPKEPLSLSAFASHVEESLKTRCLVYGDPETLVERAAVCGGAASDEWRAAQKAGAQVLVTGEVRHHHGVEASSEGFALIQAGHFETEHPGMVRLARVLADQGWDARAYLPSTGSSGASWTLSGARG